MAESSGGDVEVGVISDTHGLLRPEALEALRGADLIIHAGDVGDEDILDRLRELAPVHAVRGNVDRQPWARRLPRSTVVDVGHERLVYVVHILEELDVDPVSAGLSAVVFGHTHRPSSERKEGVLYFNPGSAGPRRFDLSPSVGRLRCGSAGLRDHHVLL